MANSKLAYSLNDDLNSKTDTELIIAAKNGNEEALEYLLEKYKDLVNMKVSKYFIIGNGSNIILPDYYDGVIIKLKFLNNYSITDDNIWIVI